MRYVVISISGRPKKCIECKRCERNCPQHLPVAGYLKQVKEVVDFLE